MREIKFRAWDTKRKIMFSAEEMGQDELTLNPDGRGFVNVHSASTKLSHYLPHFIPLQFTGLHDRNGKEIWEGDIVKTIYKKYPYEVTFYLGSFRGLDYLLPQTPMSKGWVFDNIDANECEVIGNVYENPELLKGAYREHG